MEERRTIAKGLKLLFIAEILGFTMLIPYINLITGIIILAISLFAFYRLSKIQEGYRDAFIFTLLGMGTGVLDAFFDAAALFELMQIGLGLAVSYLMYFTTSKYIREFSEDLADWGILLWKVNAIYACISAFFALLRAIGLFSLGWIATLYMLVVAAGVVLSVLYIIFLYRTYNLLDKIA